MIRAGEPCLDDDLPLLVHLLRALPHRVALTPEPRQHRLLVLIGAAHHLAVAVQDMQQPQPNVPFDNPPYIYADLRAGHDFGGE